MDKALLRLITAPSQQGTANSFGRYPDVRGKWTGFAHLAIELQLSRTFQTEISARCGHYQREGMPPVRVLFGVDLDPEEIPQSFRDVLPCRRMNAFLIDQGAIDANRAFKEIAGKTPSDCRCSGN